MKSITNENNLGSSGGGIELVDVNPNKDSTLNPMKYGIWVPQRSSFDEATSIPLNGYKQVSLYASVKSYPFYYRFGFTDGTYGSSSSYTFNSDWKDIVVPSGADRIQIKYGSTTASNYERMVYSLQV